MRLRDITADMLVPTRQKTYLFAGYIIATIALFLFSYTQVDLSLTISEASIFQSVQKLFQNVGFYHRDIALYWYIGILILFFSLYIHAIYLVKKKILVEADIWRLVGILLLLIFAYPAFSYDIFNYMFTAKTILVYHKNPYAVIPLQFTGVEPWLSFMHWTHLPSAYTPFWIALTLPMYLLGFGFFLTTLWSMKILVSTGYILCVLYIGRILKHTNPSMKSLGMAIVALNPLIIIETLVSGHNDIIMIALAMVSIYLYTQSRTLDSIFLLAIATATKFMTIFLYPVMIFGFRPIWYLSAMVVGLLLVITQREILPWYFVWIIPFVALVPKNRWVLYISVACCLGLLLRYAPFIYLGTWDNPVPAIKLWVSLLPPIGMVIFLILKK